MNMPLELLIHEAAERLKKRVRRTELIHSHYFSEKLGCPLLFKCENLQRTGAFKIRGALNFMTAQPREALVYFRVAPFGIAMPFEPAAPPLVVLVPEQGKARPCIHWVAPQGGQFGFEFFMLKQLSWIIEVGGQSGSRDGFGAGATVMAGLHLYPFSF